jgi:hypothetical protein
MRRAGNIISSILPGSTGRPPFSAEGKGGAGASVDASARPPAPLESREPGASL